MINRHITKPLDLVESICGNTDFNDVAILGIQNLVPSTVAMLLSLKRRGLDPSKVYLGGFCFSNHPDALKSLAYHKIAVDPISILYDPFRSFDDLFQANLESFIKRAHQHFSGKTINKYIILDVGGALICHHLLNKFFPRHLLIGVEQTASGIWKIEASNTLFPVIDLASSHIKRTYEPTIIALSVSSEIERYLKRVDKPYSRVAVVGRSSIGDSIYKNISKNHDTEIFSFREISQNPQALQQISSSFDIIVGCSGHSIIQGTESLQSICTPIVFANAAFSDSEFNAKALRRLAKSTSDFHTDIIWNGITLLNSGFPINFHSRYDTVDSKEFHLTRAIIAAGLVQAITQDFKEETGLIQIDAEIESALERLHIQSSAPILLTK